MSKEQARRKGGSTKGENKHVPLKRAGNSAARGGGAIERFIERTLAPRLEELAGEIRGLHGNAAV